jgi:hypothetical protein
VLSAGRHTFGSAVTRRQAAGWPGGVFTATIAARPGEQVQMDGTPLDVMAVMGDGVIGRPELVAAVDVATRTICAAVLRPVGAKAVVSVPAISVQLVSGGGRPSRLRRTVTASSTGPLAAVSCRSNTCSRDSDSEPAAAAVRSGRAWLLMTSNRAIVSVPAGNAMRASR